MGAEEYKQQPLIEPADQFEQQLFDLIPSLVERGITFDQVAFNPYIDSHANQLFQYIQHDPDRVQRIQNAFMGFN